MSISDIKLFCWLTYSNICFMMMIVFKRLYMKLEELLKEIEIAESELEELKEAKLQYEQDKCKDDELAEIRVDIMGAERNLKALRDRLKEEHI